MGNRFKLAVLVAAMAAVLATTAMAAGKANNKPVTVRTGNLELTFDGGFSPKALSKTKPTPISLDVSGEIKTVDGTHPPALKEVIVETDKNGAIDVTGYPTCQASQLQSQDSVHAEAICKDAILGKGTTDIEIAFPEQRPIPVHSPLILFNGGTKGGVTTLFVHAYITVPTPAAVVTTVKVSRVHNGRYGVKSIASVPKIAGGSGSVTSFGLTVDKKFTYKGKKVSVLTLKCPDGKVQAKGTVVFVDGSRATAEVLRTCTPKG